MSIRWQLSLLIGLVVAVVVTAMGAGLYVGERAHLLRKMEEGRRASLSQFFQGAADASAVRDDIALLNAAESMAQTPGVREAFLVDSTGLILAHSDVNRVGSRAKGVARGEGDWKEAGEVFFQASKTFPLLPHRTVQAVVVYSRTAIDRSVRDALRQTFRIILGVSAAVLLLGLAGASVLALSLARPIQRLTEGTQAVAQGRLDHRVGSARRDELGRLAQNFDLMAERLGELDRMKNDFVANVTHELRSPLSAIESCVNVMIDNMRAGETADNLEFLTLVRNNVARLARFINDLLDVARIEAHRLDLSLGPVRVADLAAEVAGLYREKAREKGIELTVEGGPDGLVIQADPDKLHLVLCNLMGNALKFTPERGAVRLSAGTADAGDPLVARCLRKGARPASRYVRFTVKDTGPGIEPADQERIFNRFEQAKTPAKGPRGTGLGLAICRGWVEAHGGVVGVESRVGQGSAFHVFIPAEGSL